MDWLEQKLILDEMRIELADLETAMREARDEQRQNELREVHKSVLLKIEDQEMLMRGLSDE